MKSKSRPTPGGNAPATSAKTATASAPPPEPAPKVQPLFRSIDWLTFFITFAIVGTIYFLTLSPQVTLEDSGELCTGSFYAGIPHPPGYPFWAIYTWFWTEFVPFGNVAFRVELAEAFAATMACGLVAFMVSRGGSMLMEGIEELRGLPAKWENAICLVCGLTAGLLLAMGSSMWKESVVINRISPFGVPWLTLVLVCLMRWIYAPHQRRFLYIAMFFFGICATIHQTLIVAAMGIEIGIASRSTKLGRDLFLANSVVYLFIFALMKADMLPSLANAAPMVLNILHGVGLCSIAACVWLTIETGSLCTEWLPVVIMGVVWCAGFAFYFWEPLAGMSNPPMEWGYPRTPEGFFHALSRGQYDKINPTDIFSDPLKFVTQLGMLFNGLADAFSWVYMFIALLPFLFLFKMAKRERAWMITVAAIYPFLGVLLTIFLDPTPERQTADLVKVFYTASHADVALMIGYGLVLTAAYMATHYQNFRPWGLLGGGAAVMLAIYSVYDITGKHYFGLKGNIGLDELPHWIAQAFASNQYGLPVFGALALLALTVIFVAAVFFYRNRAPLLITLALFTAMPVYSGFSHWFHSEQRNHWFGYWFGHDMFTPPYVDEHGQLSYDAKGREAAMKGTNATMVYPEMARDAVLFGGTDPGRFCPTYMIFCESFIPHSCQPDQDNHFDRRDVYIITQNALADNTYLDYIRAQFFRSAQVDPPFFQNLLATALPKLVHGPVGAFAWLDTIFETIGAHIEWNRRTDTSWFKPDDFTDVKSLAAKLRKGPQQDELAKFIYDQLSPDTQSLVEKGGDDQGLRRALAKDLNDRVLLPSSASDRKVVVEPSRVTGFYNNPIKGASIYTTNRFKNVKVPILVEEALRQDQLPATTVRLNRLLLEEAYPEIAHSLGGVYPDTEIYTPSIADSQDCFNIYLQDAQKRYTHDMQYPQDRYPNEPRQMKPGEDVRPGPNGGVQVSGQVAVMSINGLLTKVIFDQNPDHEFYEEESFPLDWMYPYLTPFGVIMKINRNPLREITQDILDKDHAFWSQYSTRTIGNWINYDTSISNVCNWAEQVYLRHDYTGFTGDRGFTRDDDAQKAFSKLRSSIGTSIYIWRMQHSANKAELDRVAKEAEFALKQSFAYCPYSPEAVFHLMNFLMMERRPDDAMMVLKTCEKLDPYNTQIAGIIASLESSRGPGGKASGTQMTLQQAIGQVQTAMGRGDTNVALQMLDQILHFAQTDPSTLMNVADLYLKLGELGKSEEALIRLTTILPSASEGWYNLAVIQSHRGETAEGLQSMKKALMLNDSERAQDPSMVNLRTHVLSDPSAGLLRQAPQFQAMVSTNH